MDCELANDSDPGTEPHASATACGKVRSKFQNITGHDLPCEVPAVTCPCNDIPGRFQNVVTNQPPIDHCFTDPSGGIGLELVGSPYSIGSFPSNFNGQWTCEDLQPFGDSIAISPEQGHFCAGLLKQVAASQGVPCLP